MNEAEQILLRMARHNGKNVTNEQKEIISEVLKKLSNAEDKGNSKLSPKDMFRY